MELEWLLQIALPIVGYATSSMLGHGGPSWTREEVKRKFPEIYPKLSAHEFACAKCRSFYMSGTEVICSSCMQIVAEIGRSKEGAKS